MRALSSPTPSLNAAGEWPVGVIVASARGKPWPPAAAEAYARPAPLSIRDSFGPDPDLWGSECYVYREGPEDWTLLLVSGGGGAELISRARLEICTAAASWIAARGAAVVIWHGNFWDMPAASRGAVQ